MSIEATYSLLEKIKSGIGGDVHIYISLRDKNMAIRTYWNDSTDLRFEKTLSGEAIKMAHHPDILIDAYIEEAKRLRSMHRKATSK